MLPKLLIWIISGSFGAIIGSFLTVCIYRIPFGRVKGSASVELEDKEEQFASHDDTPPPELSLISPSRSFCPHCNHQLKWWHNIPVFSWLLLQGKCSFCKVPISPRYLAVELLSAFFCIAAFEFFDPVTALLVYAFTATLIVLSFIDAEYYILPNIITYPSFIIAAIIVTFNQFFHFFSWPIAPDLTSGLIGMAFGAGFFLLISEGYLRLRGKVGLGMGDVKLLAVIGMLCGFECSFVTIFAGSVLGSVFGILSILVFKGSASKPLPFGPYLISGTILYIYFGLTMPGTY